MNSTFIRILLPAFLVYLAFSFFGPTVGAICLILMIGLFVWFNRSVFYQNRANKKYLKGDFDGALNDLKTAVSIAPKSPKVRGTYAYLLLKLGNTQEASVQINEASDNVTLKEDKNSLTQTKAMILWKQGRIDEAIQDLEDLLETYENTNVYATLGFLYIEKGDMDKALEFNLKAVDFNDTNAIILDNLGVCYINNGEYDKANEIYAKILKLKPTFPEAFYNYARVLNQLGDKEKALYMVRHSLTLRFWNISTVGKSEVEAFLKELETKDEEIKNHEGQDNFDQHLESKEDETIYSHNKNDNKDD